MNRYKKLFSSTVILGVGTFSSKLLSFLLVRLYTGVLSTEQYGITDVLITTINLMIPLVSLGITNAVLRFGLEKEQDKTAVFSNGFFSLLGSFACSLLLVPVFLLIPNVGDYTFYIFLYIFVSLMHTLCAQFSKANQFVMRYAISGLLNTVTLLGCNLLFLLVFEWGIRGYLLSIIAADFVSAVFLVLTGGYYRFVRWKARSHDLWKRMLFYSLPLMPTTAFWWITDSSDRYMITYMLPNGAAVNGLYAAAYKIPTIITVFVGIFMEAWQISFLGESSPLARQRFFSRVFAMYQSVSFVLASGLIVFARLLTAILVAPEYQESWRYIPMLIGASTFSSLVTFFGSIYLIEKKSIHALWTTIVGAGLNIAGNFLLIPAMSGTGEMRWAYGAALATLLSYVAVFLIRAIHSRRLIPFRWNVPLFVTNVGITTAQGVLLMAEVPLWWLWEGLLLAVMLVLNGRTLWQSVRSVIDRRSGRSTGLLDDPDESAPAT